MTTRSTVLVAVSTAAGLLLLTGCSGGGVTSEEPDTGGTPAPAYTSSLDIEMDPTPSAAPSQAVQEVVYPAGTTGTGIYEDDGYGRYERLTYDSATGSLGYDEAVVDDYATEAFTRQQVGTALSTANAWLVEEGFDSIVVDADRREEWYEDVSDSLTPASLDAIKATDNVGGIVQHDVGGSRGSGEAASHVVPIAGTRLRSLDLNLDEMYVVDSENDGIVPDSALVFSYSGSGERYIETEIEALAGTKAIEAFTFDLTYSFIQSDSGVWLIDGWDTDWTYGGCAQVIDSTTGKDVESAEIPEELQCKEGEPDA